MALEINHPEEDDDVPSYTVKERYCLTEDDRIVIEGDLDARWLYAIPGQEIPWSEAKKYGLVTTDTPEAEAEAEVEEEDAGEDPGDATPESAVEVISRLGTADEALVAITAALETWPEHELLLALKAQAEAVIAGGNPPLEPTLVERIDAVTNHAEANQLATELGVEGFQEKKPGVEAKKQALHEAAKAKDAPPAA